MSYIYLNDCKEKKKNEEKTNISKVGSGLGGDIINKNKLLFYCYYFM